MAVLDFKAIQNLCVQQSENLYSYVTSLKSPEGKQDDFVKILQVGIGWFLSVVAHNEEVKSKIYRLNDQICVEHSFPQSKELGITCLCDAVFCSPLFPTMFLLHIRYMRQLRLECPLLYLNCCFYFDDAFPI